jgi:prepilin-type processing-associated H-X9-DG protein
MKRLFRRGRSPCAFGLIELLVVIGILALLVAFMLPSLCRSSETANRVKCSSNLRQIGQAMLLYANDNHGHYPRTTYVAAADTKPVWGTGAAAREPFTGVQPNDVSAELFLLLRTQDITAEVFTCPSSNAEKDDFGGGSNAPVDRSNFSDIKKNLSYSIQNAYPKDGVLSAEDEKTWWTSSMPNAADFAIAADINPGTSPASYDDVLKPTPTSSAKDIKLANSNNHDKDGQNILYGDGHVAWENSPFAGAIDLRIFPSACPGVPNHDNIYTTSDATGGAYSPRVVASPADRNDSVLLPTDD